jgi:hypothetical protein
MTVFVPFPVRYGIVRVMVEATFDTAVAFAGNVSRRSLASTFNCAAVNTFPDENVGGALHAMSAPPVRTAAR